jgi:hypothetical protein
VFDSRLGGLARGSSGVRRAPRAFALIGAQWSGPRGARVELRVQYADDRFSRWFDASPRHGGAAEPIYTGVARRYELRTSAPLTDVIVHFVAPQTNALAAVAAAALPRFAAGPGQPPIVPRAAWATPECAPRVPPSFGEIALAFVHHTQGINAYAPTDSAGIVQGICLFHRNVNGWHDIGYNFLVDRYGQIFEGRLGGIDEPVAGAQAGGFNFASTGVSMIGSFISEVPPPQAMQALERLLAWKLALHGVPSQGRTSVRVSQAGASWTAFAPGELVSLQRISGHRDGDQTDCPGDALYGQLPALRPRVEALAGPTHELTLAVSARGRASGQLRERGGAPLPNEPIELQRRHQNGAVTIASTVTGPDGSWGVDVQLKESVALRALHRRRPAVVSRAVEVAVAPVITLALAGPPTPRLIALSGTVEPAKRAVTVNLYALRGTRRKLVSRTRAPVHGRSFVAAVRVPRPGAYLLVAHTPADVRNARGSSRPLVVSV